MDVEECPRCKGSGVVVRREPEPLYLNPPKSPDISAEEMRDKYRRKHLAATIHHKITIRFLKRSDKVCDAAEARADALEKVLALTRPFVAGAPAVTAFQKEHRSSVIAAIDAALAKMEEGK